MATLFGTVHLELPAGWTEQTVYTFVAPELPAAQLPTLSKVQSLRANLLVSRHPMPHDGSLEDIARAQIEGARRELVGFRLLGVSDARIAGHPARDARSTFNAEPDGLTVQQRQLFVAAPPWLYIVTATSSPSEAARLDDLLDAMLRSMRFGASDGA